MKKLPVFALLLLFGVTSINLNAQFATSKSKTQFFEGSYDNFLREARKQNKVAIIDFWASWCAPCKKMDNETFANSEVSRHINENYLIYKVNVDTFDGMEIANRFGVESFPTIITLDSRGKFIKELKGFFPPNHLIDRLSQSSEQLPAYVSL